jgi:hypothetical protein
LYFVQVGVALVHYTVMKVNRVICEVFRAPLQRSSGALSVRPEAGSDATSQKNYCY